MAHDGAAYSPRLARRMRLARSISFLKFFRMLK
jgi:hypothetical protein